MAKEKMSEDDANRFFITAQEGVGPLEACGEKHGQTYYDFSEQLYLKTIKLLEIAGFDIDEVSRELLRRIKAIKEFNRGNSLDNCQLVLRRVKSDIEAVDKQIVSLTKKSKVKDTNTTVCSRPADYYAEQYKKYGKMSDAACFQRAGQRELNATLPGR
jgi:DNA-binding transcriptional MerR regulator